MPQHSPKGIKKMVHKLAGGSSGPDSAEEPVVTGAGGVEQPPKDGHRYTESYVKAVAHALIEQGFSQLSEKHNVEVISNIIRAEAEIALKYGQSQESRLITRTAVSDCIDASCDALNRRWLGLCSRMPYAEAVVLGAAAIGAVFGLGLLLSLWRFVFFGLR